MHPLLVLALSLATVSALPYNQRIVGGSVTTISQYPFGVSMLRRSGSAFRQACGGSILNNRAVLSAAHCFDPPTPANWRMRVGSTNANSGGVVHTTQAIFNHPNYVRATLDLDVSVLRITGAFTFTNNVRAGSIAGANHNTPDNAAVWAIGWGRTTAGGQGSEQLRHVQMWAVNQVTCRNRYAELRHTVTANMLCAGWLDVGGRDTCQGDSGGALLRNNVIVGVTSWGHSCATPRHPGVYARVSRVSNWIRNMA